METAQTLEAKKSPNQSKVKTNTTPIRVTKITAKKINVMIQKLNKKLFGKSIRVDDVLKKALSLLEEKHFKEIKEASLSNADKLEIQYREYCKNNGQITQDEFLGILMRTLGGNSGN
ncbi:MAG: hypothetical protein KAQ98_07585 [Bacteriovoracaceae bacterium]|nr:hypothetical protein [Bacteriovoracaceae bacterium]